MERSPGWMEKLSLLSCLAAGLIAVLMMLLVFASVVMRYLFNRPFTFTEEVTGYFVLFVVFMGLAYTFVTEGHIRTDIVTRRLPPAGQRLLKVVSGLAALVWTVVVVIATGQRTLDYAREGTRSFTGLQTPLWIPSLFMFLGSLLLLAQLLVWLWDAAKGREVDLGVREEVQL